MGLLAVSFNSNLHNKVQGKISRLNLFTGTVFFCTLSDVNVNEGDNMSGKYHAGELAVQRKAGVSAMAQKVGNIIRPNIPAAAQDFLAEQKIVAISSVDVNNRVWATLLYGEPGFVQILDETTIVIQPQSSVGDPLFENLKNHSVVGMIALDAATRRRMRLNGQADLQPDGSLKISSQQVYANCPKYIQARQADDNVQSSILPVQKTESTVLNQFQQNWIAGSDTFFVATYHPESNTADASHRGGLPGFVRVVDEQTLIWPDYSGNTMFNTLGNIAANPNTGLIFPDWQGGHTLQLTGQAQIIWDEEQIKLFTGAERLVQFKVAQVVQTNNAFAANWQFLSYSPHNPR
jgi:uncharacterized protein